MYIYFYAFPVQPKKTEESCADSDPGVVTRIPDPHPLENHNLKGFLRNTAQEPLDNHKAIQPAFNFGPPSTRQRNAIWMAFRWWADGGPLCLLDRVSFSYTGTDPSLSLWQKSCRYFGNPTDETFWIRALTLNTPIATKVVCFSRLLKCLRSLNCKQCEPRSGAVCSGSTLFSSILNSSVMLDNYLQQTTFSDAFFLAL